jgi:AhpC/TSA family
MRAFSLFVLTALALSAAETTVIYDGAASKLSDAASESENLWVTLPDLTRATRFVLKPQGACLDEFCVPIPKSRKAAFLKTEHNQKLFNLTELARTIKQPAIHDETNAIWLFGSRPQSLSAVADTLEAPDFTLPDWKGTPRSLHDFRGKRVLLVTWASW